MHSFQDDRRKNNQAASFPLMDKDGHIVHAERRSGQDRRKNKRQQEVANKILSIFH